MAIDHRQIDYRHLAGVFDGCGVIGFGRWMYGSGDNKRAMYYPRVRLSLKGSEVARDLLERVKGDLYGVGGKGGNIYESRTGRLTLTLVGCIAVEFLGWIGEFVVVKRREVDYLVDVCHGGPKWGECGVDEGIVAGWRKLSQMG